MRISTGHQDGVHESIPGPVLRVLWESSYRWKSLHLDMLAEHVPDLPLHNFSLLEKAWLRVGDQDIEKAILEVSCLQKLALEGNVNWSLPTHLSDNHQFPHIMTLDLRVEDEDWPDTLSMFPNFATLYLHTSLPCSNFSTANFRYTLPPTCKTLVIAGFWDRQRSAKLTNLLRCIKAPGLMNLVFTYDSNYYTPSVPKEISFWDADVLQAFQSFVQASGHKLYLLSFENHVPHDFCKELQSLVDNPVIFMPPVGTKGTVNRSQYLDEGILEILDGAVGIDV